MVTCLFENAKYYQKETLEDKRKNEPIIAGDINLGLLNYERHLPTANYLDLITEYRFLPKIVRPTRIKKQSATLIDHIFLKDNSLDLGSSQKAFLLKPSTLEEKRDSRQRTGTKYIVQMTQTKYSTSLNENMPYITIRTKPCNP